MAVTAPRPGLEPGAHRLEGDAAHPARGAEMAEDPGIEPAPVRTTRLAGARRGRPGRLLRVAEGEGVEPWALRRPRVFEARLRPAGCAPSRRVASDHRPRRPGDPLLSIVVELGVPVRIALRELPPARRRVPVEEEREPERLGEALRLHRHRAKLHAGLRRRAPSLPLVARRAADHDVLPARVAALRSRDDVIVGGLWPRDPVAAVLAAPVVARVHVLAAELHRALAIPDLAQEPDDARHLELEGYGPHRAVLVLLDDLDLALEQQGQGPFPAHARD